jgi:hypothetical protein
MICEEKRLTKREGWNVCDAPARDLASKRPARMLLDSMTQASLNPTISETLENESYHAHAKHGKGTYTVKRAP